MAISFGYWFMWAGGVTIAFILSWRWLTRSRVGNSQRDALANDQALLRARALNDVEGGESLEGAFDPGDRHPEEMGSTVPRPRKELHSFTDERPLI